MRLYVERASGFCLQRQKYVVSVRSFFCSTIYLRPTVAVFIQHVQKLYSLSGNYKIFWKISNYSRKCLACLEFFLIVWKISVLSGNFLDCLENHFACLEMSNFPDCLVFSSYYGRFPDCLETFWIV